MSAAFANFAQNFSSSIGAQPVSAQPRGLYNFILAIRNAQSKEEERTRVDKVSDSCAPLPFPILSFLLRNYL